MADSVPGPSKQKKSKNPNILTEEDILAYIEVIYSSDEDDDYLGDANADCFFEQSENNSDSDDDSEVENSGSSSPHPDLADDDYPNWTDISIDMKDFPFTRNNELLVPIPGSNEPIEYFRMLFDDVILNLIVDETNYNAEEVGKRVSEKSRLNRWKPVTADEMITFVALLLHTGTIKLNRIQDYWKGHPLFNLKCFSSHMSRDRFLLILRCLHFARNPAGVELTNDRLHKIRPVINFFNNKISSIYYPGKELSLDEPMVLWRGRLTFRQNMKNKNHRNSIKLYMLTEPNGIVLKATVSTGALDETSGKGHNVKNVVLDLLKNYFDSGHSIYMGSVYNSYELASHLTRHKTYCTGILSYKRKNNAKEVIDKKLKKGETISRYANNIMIGKWKDKHDALYISNEYKNYMIQYIDKKNRNKKKPAPIFYYNKHMAGVNRQDQLNSYYPCETMPIRWYKKLAIHFFQLLLLNAYLLHRKYSGHKLSMYDFRISLLSSLLHIEKTKTPVQKATPQHVLKKIDEVRSDGRVKRKRCKECTKNKIRKQTIYHCEKCPGQPGFCVGECFKNAHG